MAHPYLTADIPGCGGAFKESDADFVVREIPLYEPCGSGEHVYARIEKQGLTTLEAIRRLAQALKVPERDIGYAGMKDARGITEQTLSIPGVDPELVAALAIPGLKVLAAIRHGNKLRLGHLAGNSFAITIRGIAGDCRQQIGEILAILSARGVPNYFGQQRYGSLGNSADIGLRLLGDDPAGAIVALFGNPDEIDDERWRSGSRAFHAGDLPGALELLPPHCRTEREVVRTLLRKPGNWAGAVKSIHPRLINLYLSAAQSALFDRVVAARIGSLDRVTAGDVAWKHDNGACFLVTDELEAAERAAAFTISATGPMFGRKMLAPAGAQAELEQAVLAAAGLERNLFDQTGRTSLSGERRPLRVPVHNAGFELAGDRLTLAFALPKGSYATTLLREIMK